MTTGLPRKRVLLLMVGIFIIGNFVSAIAPSYLLLIAARVLAPSPTARSSGWAPWSPPAWCRPTARPEPSA